ncbi:hypothetical protein CMQ_8280 [Grosmannia clavigera kw1407]|uniref:Uncharacterized protein n=1 Tax=Grosmannia clavigera (strain kw1407 / UAMH 11150) TaxID=655863 RepID=F0XKP0_GROCL|nr:uncharacterized protein CMQ_8280 [Grosmannia clavigera kw1407]EFX01814.1 hypothetical protein CMQ_8280 [Grosmannia clavigera kw1407]
MLDYSLVASSGISLENISGIYYLHKLILDAKKMDQDVKDAGRDSHVENIVRHRKNHEFRNYKLPTQRMWIYETRPASAIRFRATISHGKRPGEIKNPSGLRNDEFDRGDLAGRVQFGYEILKLERLAQPISLEELKKNGWLKGPPQKYCFVMPAFDKVLQARELELVFDATTARASGTTACKATQVKETVGKDEIGNDDGAGQSGGPTNCS